VLLMVAFFMYGTMIWTIFPQEPGISFEYHFFGAVSGVVCAVLLSHRDPKPQVKTYDWEEESEDDEPDEYDLLIGDQWKLDPKPAEPAAGVYIPANRNKENL
jgi:hypothetical protein